MKDRIAVAYPQMGVKVWLWVNGEFQSPGALDPELTPGRHVAATAVYSETSRYEYQIR